MDGNHPNRKKDKQNPYTLSIENGTYYIAFADGQQVKGLFPSPVSLFWGMGLYLKNCISIRQTHSHCYCDEHKPL